MKVGDRVEVKNLPCSLTWIIKEFNYSGKVRLEALDGSVSQWIYSFVLNTGYIKVNSENNQTSFYDNNSWPGLPKGKEEENKKYCYHEFVKYVGLKEVYMYCTKCDEKKPVEE